ncbi:MAG: CPBP family intramembrane metalloprotease [Pseudomonadota bacterium]|nr:CPBP family intramembrane metalloprotease [Pseudomonadota bacterium]
MAIQHSDHRTHSLATFTGLFVALVVPFLTFVAGQAFFGAELSSARVFFGLAFHWISLAALVAIVLWWERRPLQSIGLRLVRWWTIPAGLLAGIAIMILSGSLVSVLRLSLDANFVSYMQSLPFLIRALVVVTAGMFEETLYRGYALERLTTIWGSKWLAGMATVAVFTLAHLPTVGISHLLPVVIISILVTLLYLWRRDLILNMVAHSTIDAVGLLLAPIARHGVH